MNPHFGSLNGPDSAREAINRVLEAEKHMMDGLDRCRERAEEIVAEARADARRILRRTEDRLHRLHQRCEEQIEAQFKSVEAEFDSEIEPGSSRPEDDEALRIAVQQLARMLTTAERDGPGQ